VSVTFDPPVGPSVQELGSMPAPPPPDPDLEPGPAAAADDDGKPPLVDESIVRSVLQGLGNMASMVDRAAPGLWQWTEAELDAIVPPFTRLANHNDTLRRALLSGDYVILAMTMSQYAVRNVTTRKAAVDAQRQRNQISGAGRPGGGVPASAIVGGGGGQPHAGDAGRGAANGAGGNQ
jgi:hypothetical protein